MTSLVIIIIVSLLFSGFFSGMEIAFVSADRLKFELDKEKPTISNAIIGYLFKNSQQFISTILVGNNIALVIYGLQMAKLLEGPLATISENEFVILLSQTVISTAIVLVTGEFLPKTIFRVNPNLWLQVFAFPILCCYVMLYPIAKLSTFISMTCLKIAGVKDDRNSKHSFTKVDLQYWFEENLEKADEQTMESEVKYFKNALDFSSVRLRDCMIPRNEIVALEEGTNVDILRNKFVETGLSKIIIFHESIDNVLGYIHSSEMFRDASHWKRHIIQIPIVPETMSANRLMEMMVKKKKSMAVVVDEFGGTSGIVTHEDILEEIVGEIEDEHDNSRLIARQVSENTYVISGRMEIDAINQMFNLSLPENEEYVTIAGLVLHEYEDFPKTNEVVKFGNFKVKILKETDNKIELVKLFVEDKED